MPFTESNVKKTAQCDAGQAAVRQVACAGCHAKYKDSNLTVNC